MSLKSWVETRLPQLQAKVGLLQLLNDTPSLPSENAPNVASISGSAHVLPFLKEKELVQTLAFIASSTDDPAKVIAVCVEEGIDQKSMTVKLAVNTGDLDNVVVAFKRIAIVLQRNCKGGDGEIDDVEVTREVIRLNRNRILCRLRSRHARTKSQHARLGRPKPLLSLAHVLANVKKSTSQDVLVPQFEEVIGELCECFVQLENLSESEGRSETGLVLSFAIIMAARKLHCSRSIAKLLELSDYDDTQKVHIRHTVSKLGRYSTASEFLVQAARKYTVFAKITVQFITVSALPFPPIKHLEIFAETLRTGLLSAKELWKTSSKVRDRLEIKSLASACSRTSSAKFKVHAEIQLLFHYETYIAPLRPRVLCSSKHACFLCELFIRSHGKFFLPSSHGRLYAQWTLPASLPGLLGEAAETMIIVLEIFAASIQESLRSQILFTKKRFPAPNESVMLGSVIWSDPAEALPDSIPNDSGYDKTDIKSDETTSTSTLQSKTTSDRSKQNPNSIRRVDSVSDVVEREIEALPASTGVTSPEDTSAIESSPYTMLARGQATVFDLSDYTNILKLGTPGIHLTFSYASWVASKVIVSDSRLPESDIGCKLTLLWLHTTDVVDVNPKVINLSGFPESFQDTFDRLAGSCDFYVVKGRETISIKTTYCVA